LSSGHAGVHACNNPRGRLVLRGKLLALLDVALGFYKVSISIQRHVYLQIRTCNECSITQIHIH
jgi:hypothetical protein